MRWRISSGLFGWWLSLALCASAGAAAHKTPRVAAPDGNRFLVVVETSSAMLPFEHSGRQAVFDLIYSGIGNQAQAGDTLGIWNFGEDAHGGVFPMQVWDAEQNLHLASVIGLFLKNQKYESEGRLDRVLPKLLSLMKAVKDVNILIVSGPQHVWKGTPFDVEINAVFEKHAVDSLAEKRPLITALVARNGALVSWSAVLAGEPIVLPRITIEKAAPAPALQPPAAVARVNSNAAPAVRSIVITSKKPEADEALDPGTVRITVAKKEPVASTQPASGESEATFEIKALPVAKAEDATASSGPQPATSLAKPAGTNGLEAAKPSLAVKTESPTASAPGPAPARAAIAPGVVTVAAREKASGVALATVSPPQPLVTPRSLIWLGTALTFAALGLFWVAWRLLHTAPRQSFITQSFERDK